MASKSDSKQSGSEASTPGRPHDTSRQQKHPDQQLESGSETLDRKSRGEDSHRKPTPPGPK
jgi:hypothetical protein